MRQSPRRWALEVRFDERLASPRKARDTREAAARVGVFSQNERKIALNLEREEREGSEGDRGGGCGAWKVDSEQDRGSCWA